MATNCFGRLLLLVFAIFLLTNGLYANIEEDDGILVLDANNIPDALTSHEYLLVLYYEPTSKASRDFLSKLPALAKHLHNIHSSIHVAKFEGYVKYVGQVKSRDYGYPSLVLHYGGQWTEYKYKGKEGREYEKVVLWLEDEVGEDVLFGRDQNDNKNANGQKGNVVIDMLLSWGLTVLLILHI